MSHKIDIITKLNYQIEKLEFQLRNIDKLLQCKNITVTFDSEELNKRFSNIYVINKANDDLRNILKSEKEIIIETIKELETERDKLLR